MDDLVSNIGDTLSDPGSAIDADAALETSVLEYKLPEIVIGDHAAVLADEILARRGKNLSIDARQVRQIDTQCIGVLVAARKLWVADDFSFQYVNPTEQFRGVFDIVGIDLPVPDTCTEAEPFKVLTVDDSRTMRQMLHHCLTEAGFEVIAAENGLDGLEKFAASNPDVVITDMNMPIMDGCELIKSIRASDFKSRVPILVLTTESSQEKQNHGRDLGATGWITKPFDPAILLRSVDSMLPTGRTER